MRRRIRRVISNFLAQIRPIKVILLFCVLIPLSSPAGIHDRFESQYEFLAWLSQSPSPSARMFAAGKLGKIDDPRAFDILRQTAKENYWFVRQQTAWSLGSFGEQAIPVLKRLLKDKDLETACVAAHSLGEIQNAKAVKYLIKALRDSRHLDMWSVSYSAAKAIVTSGSIAVPELLKEIRTQDPRHRELVVSLLSKIGDNRACSSVRHRLSDWDDRVRTKAVEALGSMGCTSYVSRLEDYVVEEPDLRDIAARSLAKLGTDGIDALIRLYNHEEINVRLAAIHALSFTGGNETVRVLESALKDTILVIRRAAAKACRSVIDPSLIEPLKYSGCVQDSGVQHDAVTALILMKDEKAWPILSCVVRDTTIASKIRETALSGLAYIQSGASDTLKTYLNDKDPNIRYRAVWLVLHVFEKGLECNAVLYERLKDPSAKVRAAALSVLLKIADSVHHVPLIPFLDDPDDEIRKNAFSILVQFCEPDSFIPIFIRRIEAVESTPSPREIRALGRFGGEGVFPTLAMAYEKGSRDIKAEVLRAMGKIASPEAMEYLLRDMGNEDNEIRTAALKGLASTKADTAASIFTARLKRTDPGLRITGAKSLSGFRQQFVVQVLIEALKDEHYKVRSAAATALSWSKADSVVEAISAVLEKETSVKGNPDSLIRVLAKIGTPAAIHALEQACYNNDSSSGVAAYYLWGLLFKE